MSPLIGWCGSRVTWGNRLETGPVHFCKHATGRFSVRHVIVMLVSLDNKKFDKPTCHPFG